MDKRRGLIFNTGLILLFLLQVITALKITQVRVPSSYRLSHDEAQNKPLILGCDYDIDDETSKGFVLKWKHNDLQFYQWIPSRNPIVFSSFKGHIDVSYFESDDRLHKHSVLKFINPMANYTGNYTCQVSTFDELVSSTAHLQMIVPETDFSMGFQRETNGSTVVFCNVGEIYPLPDVSLRIDDQKVSDVVAFEQVQEYTGYYNVSVQYILPDPNQNLELQCDVTIPATDYTRHISMPYQGKLPSDEAKNNTIIENEGKSNTLIENEEKHHSLIEDEEKSDAIFENEEKNNTTIVDEENKPICNIPFVICF